MSDDEADDADIYENLPNFFLDESYKNLEEEKKELKIKVEELGKQLDEIKKENEKLAAKVKALGKNISCLYKTAIRELERKDQIIADLRKERDDLLFRRGTSHSSISATKRSSRKQLTPTKKIRNGSLKRPDLRLKLNASSKPEGISSLAKAVETIEPLPPKEKTPEKILPVMETAVAKEVYPKSEGKLVGNKPEKSKTEEKPPEKSKRQEKPPEKSKTEEKPPELSEPEEKPPEESPKSECNSKEETIMENSLSEKAPANVSNIQILSGSEDSFVQTPSSDKFTSHATTEDCGFGRRRKVRRIIRATSSSAGSTPVRSTSEVEANGPPEEQPPSAKRVCVEADLSSDAVCTSVDKVSSCLESNARNIRNAMEERACEKISEDVTHTLGNSIPKDSSASQKCKDNVPPNIENFGEEVGKGRITEQIENNTRKEDEHHSHVVFESCEVDQKVSSTDELSSTSGNVSNHSQSDCTSLLPINRTTVEVKSRTTTYVEEYNVSSIEFDNNRCISSGESSTPRSDRVMFPEGDGSPREGRGKRSRSWERERNHVDCSNHNQDDGKRIRHSGRDSYREKDRRDSYYSRDYRSRMSSSGGGDRMRRMERDPRFDRNYRSRMRDHDEDRSRSPDYMRHRDHDRRDSGRHRRSRSRERRGSDSFHGSSSRKWDSERGSGHLSRERIGREMEEKERSRSRSKSDRSPKITIMQNDEHLRSNCIPPTEWD